VAAEFADLSLTVGRIALPDGGTRWVVFNWGDEAVERVIKLERSDRVVDAWSGDALEARAGAVSIVLPARSARLIDAR
jgi:hypothetical protein